MRTVLIVTMAMLLLHGGIRPAHADFVLERNNPGPQGTPPTPPPGPGPVAPARGAAVAPDVTTPVPEAPYPARPLRPPRDPDKPINLLQQKFGRAPIAHGFGHDVPLSFAVRQIVPERLRVMYANQADLSALVSWKGGQAWNVVLANAVRPLGDRVSVSPATVRIYRASASHRRVTRADRPPAARRTEAVSLNARATIEAWQMTEQVDRNGSTR